MKVVLKRSKFTKGGKCKGKVKVKGRSRRKICFKVVKVR